MPFDRLLLTCSPTYLRTRALLLKCGVRFKPAVVSRPNNFRSFDPAKNTLVYTPLEPELRWISSQKTDSPWIPELVPKYYFFSTTLCHESAHALIYRLLRFKGMNGLSMRENKNYIYLAETLVVVQEAIVAMELQQIATPLENFGILYRSVQDKDVVRGRLAGERYVSQLCRGSFFDAGGPSLQAFGPFEIFREIGETFRAPPLDGIEHRFYRGDFTAVGHDYFKKTKNRIFLPKTPRSLKSASLIIDPVSPKQLLSDRGTQERLRSWFKNLYG